MDAFHPFNGTPASNGSGSQGDTGSQGAPGVNPAGLPIPPTNGQGGGEIAPAYQNDSARQTLW